MASTPSMVVLTLAAFLLLADVTAVAGALGVVYELSAAEKQVTSAQPSRNAPRKLMANVYPSMVAYDYVTVFCVEQGTQAYQQSYLAGFDSTTLYIAINTCGGQKIRALNTTVDVYTPRVIGSVTEDTIPGGRSISWHVEGSNVFAFIVDALFDPRTSARFSDSFDDSSNIFLGTNPETEGFIAAGLSKADLQSILSTASFVWDYAFTVMDGSHPGDPFTRDTLNDPTAVIVHDDMTATITGVLRSTPNLHYRNGNPAIASFKQVNIGAPEGTGPFDFPGSPETAIETEFDLNILSPTANDAHVADLILQVTGNTPKPTDAPTTPTETSAPVSNGFPVGGVCDSSSKLPNQCFSAKGDRYVCCASSCPSNPTETPRCG